MINYMIDRVYDRYGWGLLIKARYTVFNVQKSHLGRAPDRPRFSSTSVDLCMCVCSVGMFVCTAYTSQGLGCLSKHP